MRPRRPSRTPILLAYLLLPACDAAPPSDDPVVIRDSAGVEVIHSRSPAWEEGTPLRLADTPSLTIGEPPSSAAEEFTNIWALFTLPDGRVVALNSHGPPEIRIFEADGTHALTLGGLGEGPGEMGLGAEVGFAPPDTLVLYDVQLRRVSRFHTDGPFLGSTNMDRAPPLPSGALLWDRFGDGTFLLRPNARLSGVEGGGRSQLPALRARADGSVVDTIGIFPDQDHAAGDEGRATAPLFARRAATVAHELTYLTGMGDDFTIDEYDLSGRHLRRIRRDYDPRPVLDEHLRHYWEELGREPDPDRPVADHFPAFERSWVVGTDGRFWIQHYRAPGDETHTWSVFEADGRWLGEVEGPAAFRVWEAGPDYLLGVWLDDFDVQTIRRYPLVEGG
jgi:hypothetical protein